MKEKDICNENYRGYNLIKNKEKEYKYYTKTLDQVIDQIEYSSTVHSKSLFGRYDIRNPLENSEKKIERKDMTRIMENTKRNIKSRYKNSKNKPDLQYTWTTENEGKENKNHHFHVSISVNANAVKNAQPVFEALNKATMSFLETKNKGLVQYTKSDNSYYGGIIIDRNSPNFNNQIEKAVKLGSYLAKVDTKEERPKSARVSSSSRLPKNWMSKINRVVESKVKND